MNPKPDSFVVRFPADVAHSLKDVASMQGQSPEAFIAEAAVNILGAVLGDTSFNPETDRQQTEVAKLNAVPAGGASLER